MSRKLRTVEVVILIFSVPAIISTFARIVLRRERIWADDGWALFSLLALVVQMVAVFTITHEETAGVIRYYMIALAFYTILWSARLSLLSSIIRIDPNKKRRNWLYLIAALYIVAYILLICQLLWICQNEDQWKTAPTPQCHLTLPVGVAQLITDTLADGSLLIVPMVLFRALHDCCLRRRLMAIFSTCVITSVVSLVHAVYLLSSAGLPVEIAGIVENCVSLVVCNIPVIAAAIVRQRNNSLSGRQQITSILSTIVFWTNDPAGVSNDSLAFG